MENNTNEIINELIVKEDLIYFISNYLKENKNKWSKLYFFVMLFVSFVSSLCIWYKLIIPSKDFFEAVTFKDSLCSCLLALIITDLVLKVLDKLVLLFLSRGNVKNLEEELNTYCDEKYNHSYDVILDRKKAKEFFSIYFKNDNVVKLISAIHIQLEKSE